MMIKKYSLLVILLFACIAFSYLNLAKAGYQEEGTAFNAFVNPKYGTPYKMELTAFYAWQNQQSNTYPVYRFLNKTNGDHFFTSNQNEYNNVINSFSSTYQPEGIAFYVYNDSSQQGTVPVYRFLNTTDGSHFYTSSETEANNIKSNYASTYQPEGIAFYVYNDSSQQGTVPVYRYLNTLNGFHFYTSFDVEKTALENATKRNFPVYRFLRKNGDHFYTSNEIEKTYIQTNMNSSYTFEGIAFYVYNDATDGSSPVYRFLDTSNGNHFYTSSEIEKNSLISNSSTPYKYEGIAFYAQNTQINGTSPVYRFVSDVNGDHFYTISEYERNYAKIMGMGPEISAGLWYYNKTDIQNNPFQITANKAYKIKDSNGNTIATVNNGNDTTYVSYDDNDNKLEVYNNSLPTTLVDGQITFDAVDGDNTTMIFDTNRSNYVSSDWRGKIDHYRGKITVKYYRGPDVFNGNTGTTVTQIWIINVLPLEEYVWGSAETTGSGNINHTRVMTTMYRTYGYWYIQYATKYMPMGFKIRSDSGSQVYGGYDWETDHPNVKSAAQNTQGDIVWYGGDVAITPYSSWSDGRTRSWEEVWGSKNYPWCVSVKDPYGKNSSLSTSQLQAAGNHMVGLIANGSVNMANNGWDWQNILKYYYTNISLNKIY